MNDASIFVVVGTTFVFLQDWKLYPVHCDQFVEGEAEGHGGEYVDFDEGLAAGVVGAEGVGALPSGGEVGKEVVVEAGIVGFAPMVVGEGRGEGVGPEVGVVSSEAAKYQCPRLATVIVSATFGHLQDSSLELNALKPCPAWMTPY